MRTDVRPLRPRTPRGDTIVEALVALLLLTVGALALIGHTTTLTRDERRAATRRRAAAMLDVRAADWAAGPCVEAEGGRTVDGLAEAWASRRDADSLLVLVDSIHAPGDRGGARAGLIAVRGCDP
jgi:Tfp pilus assembly protein PilV